MGAPAVTWLTCRAFCRPEQRCATPRCPPRCCHRRRVAAAGCKRVCIRCSHVRSLASFPAAEPQSEGKAAPKAGSGKKAAAKIKEVRWSVLSGRSVGGRVGCPAAPSSSHAAFLPSQTRYELSLLPPTTCAGAALHRQEGSRQGGPGGGGEEGWRCRGQEGCASQEGSGHGRRESPTVPPCDVGGPAAGPGRESLTSWSLGPAARPPAPRCLTATPPSHAPLPCVAGQGRRRQGEKGEEGV